MTTENKTLIDFQSDWERLVYKGYADYNSLTKDERIWFNIGCLMGDVENGGLISHYYNSGADRNAETIEDLNFLGFSDIVDLLKVINQRFPNNQPSKDIDERNEVISNWQDEEYGFRLYEIDQIFFDRESELEQKLIQHIESKILRK